MYIIKKIEIRFGYWGLLATCWTLVGYPVKMVQLSHRRASVLVLVAILSSRYWVLLWVVIVGGFGCSVVVLGWAACNVCGVAIELSFESGDHSDFSFGGNARFQGLCWADGGGIAWVVAMAAVLRLGCSVIRVTCLRDSAVGASGCMLRLILLELCIGLKANFIF
ncbi:hypothetical protein GIB67_014291 [Kingdonia uniflora]|uniref:Transmembrane protein n=1 Tax=Kingdonia uniflora TaxID=39325 RepID=A0A7J7M278_9MAGN|nr:hypothetical protein GIB67_014291 [Kingdonia uniflora]